MNHPSTQPESQLANGMPVRAPGRVPFDPHPRARQHVRRVCFVRRLTERRLLPKVMATRAIMQWEFKPDRAKTNGPKRRWRWRVIDESGRVIRRSEQKFLSLKRCIEDAEQNGFVRPYEPKRKQP